MDQQDLLSLRRYFTLFVAACISGLLLWQYTHGGVPSHHLLHRADLPAISNWWGALSLPLLTWVALTFIYKRLEKLRLNNKTLIENHLCASTFNTIVWQFFVAIGYGAMLSLAFIYGFNEISSLLFFGILFFALFFKVYQAQYILGFVLSMSITFGGVLPLIFATLIGFAAFIVHTTVQFFWKHMVNITRLNKVN